MLPACSRNAPATDLVVVAVVPVLVPVVAFVVVVLVPVGVARELVLVVITVGATRLDMTVSLGFIVLEPNVVVPAASGDELDDIAKGI